MALSVFLIIIAVLGSAFISASETALLTANKVRIRALANEGDKRAQSILGLTKQPERFFGAILLANNILQMAFGAIATSLAISIGGNNGGVVAAATIGATALIVLFGELTPKTIAAVFPNPIALQVARVIYWLTRLSWPVVWVFTLLPAALTRLFGGQDASKSPTVTEKELRMLIDMGEEEGTVEKAQGKLLENIFRFGETEVRDVMTPRNDIVWVHADMTLGDFMSSYHKTAHSRFPVYDEDYDDVVGVLSIKDVMLAVSSGKLDPAQPVSKMARLALFVPETKHLDDLFRTMQQAGQRAALVVDEYGGVSGLITLSRVLERIVGRTGEEGSRPEQRFVAVDQDTFVVDGGLSLVEANDALSLGLPHGDYHTVAGFILEQLQRIPSPGDRVRYGDVRLQVAEVDGNRIAKVRVRRRPRTPDAASVA
jgi:putative hemolysin